jgi:NHLM bacteriocin system ABC transporter ATP-binding protein
MRHSRSFGRFTTAINTQTLEEVPAEVLRAANFPGTTTLAANEPLVLDDPTQLWVVVHGEVDLFHERASGDPLRATRRYVGTIWAGEVVAGAARDLTGDDAALVAVGYGEARMQAIPRSLIESATGDDVRIAQALAAGVAETIGRAMHRARRSAARPVSFMDRKLDLPDGTTITSGGPVVWVKLTAGAMSFGGHVVLGADPLLFPLARGMWLRATTPIASIALQDGFTAFISGTVTEAIERAWAVFMAWLTACAEADDAMERTRLAQKTEGERLRQARALDSLAGLLQGRIEAETYELTGDAILDACALVGRASSIEFRSPPPSPAREASQAGDGSDPHRDRVLAVCNASRVRYRRVVLRSGWWHTDAGPLLGFRRGSYDPVALLVDAAGGYVVHDPVTDQRLRVTDAVGASLDAVAYTFSTPFPAAAVTLRTLGRMLRREIWPDARRVLGFVAAGAVLGLSLPVVSGIMFNQVIPSAAMGNAVTLFIALVTVAAATALVELGRAFALIRVETRSGSLLQSAIVDRLLALPPGFFREYAVGDLALRADAINSARQALTGVAIVSLFGGALVVSSLVLMLWYSVKLAAVATVMILIGAVATLATGLYALPYERQRQALMGSIGTLVFELLSGIAKLHVAAAERRMFALWSAQFRELKVVTFRAGLAAAGLAVFNSMLPVLASASVFVIAAGMLKVPGALAAGDFIAFNAAFAIALAAGIGVSATVVSVLNVIPLFERAAPILMTAPEVDDAKPDPGILSGRIEASKVTFGYIKGAPPVLDDVSFQVRPGEFVAFVGPSGSGKSTVLRLLLGFERPGRGAVYFDGHDLASIDVGAVRRQCAVVLQNSKLLAGDVFTNIVGAAPLTYDDAWRAAERAGLAEDISAMPMGMFTVISEGGSTLSGGQRQRLLIARALVRNPRIVFFDEATSALDNRSQDIVTRSLEEMDATRIVIAHRLTTVQRADRIFVMVQGRIVQEGTYEELISVPGMFQDLARRQLV